ncbi:MAG: thioredoxin family protein [Thermoleophilia bacterium]|nr:thioredoxin family protein [Thermoleophilia bacterium]
MDIRILGSGCANCKRLHQIVERSLAQTGTSATLTKVEDIPTIMRYGVLSTPALVINEVVVSAGKVPDVAQVSTWLTTAAGREQPAN